MNLMKSINININKYFHMIPSWKSPMKLPVELSMTQAPRCGHPLCSGEDPLQRTRCGHPLSATARPRFLPQRGPVVATRCGHRSQGSLACMHSSDYLIE